MACLSVEPNAFKSDSISVCHSHRKMRSVSCSLDLLEKVFQAFVFCQVCGCPPMSRLPMVMRGPSRSRCISLRVSVCCRNPPRRAVWGLICKGKHYAEENYSKVPLKSCSSHASGQPDGLALGVCFGVPRGAFRTAQRCDVPRLLQSALCCWLRLSVCRPLVCSLGPSTPSEMLGTKEEKPAQSWCLPV